MELENLGLAELVGVSKAVAERLESEIAARKEQAVSALQALGEVTNKTPRELVSILFPAPVVVKYAHDENPALTWSGRGMQPKWLKDRQAETGKALEAFLA